jgi:hypothetical protein
MTISIADLKKKQSFLDKIKTKIDQTSSGGNRDPRFWAPTFDKETGGGAVIRFLPSADLNEVPFVECHSSFFERGEERWPHLKTDTEYEQDQSEFTDEM